MDETKPKNPPKNRINLDLASVEKLGGWRQQLTEKYPGIRVTDGDFVNAVISRQAQLLTSKQLSELKEEFFDEIKELQWRLAQAKAAKLQACPLQKSCEA